MIAVDYCVACQLLYPSTLTCTTSFALAHSLHSCIDVRPFPLSRSCTDDDGDGVLTFEEFEKLVRHIDEQMEDRTAMELFNKSLEVTHDAHVHPKGATATTTAAAIADDNDDDGDDVAVTSLALELLGASSDTVDTGETKREVGAAIDDVTGDDNDGDEDDDDDDDDDDSISPTCFVAVMLMHGHRFLIHTKMWIVDEEWIGVQWDDHSTHKNRAGHLVSA